MTPDEIANANTAIYARLESYLASVYDPRQRKFYAPAEDLDLDLEELVNSPTHDTPKAVDDSYSLF